MAQPVEYAVAVDKYLDAAHLSDASRRVYRIALNTWAWALVERPSPDGAARRGAAPPIVPLALLDEAAGRLRRVHESRGARTANRELSILRSAVAWWKAQGWIDQDPTADLPYRGIETSGEPRLTTDQASRVLALPAPLRDQALWHVVYESDATLEAILALDAADVRPGRRRAEDVRWQSNATSRLLALLLAGRPCGPLFLTDRRARTGTPAADRCPLTGRARLSYRRAAEIFTTATKSLDPQGHGWTLRQLRSR